MNLLNVTNERILPATDKTDRAAVYNQMLNGANSFSGKTAFRCPLAFQIW